MQTVEDFSLLQGIMANLFKDAIKYSLLRYREKVMEVRVLGQPQSGMEIILVENWEIGIAADQMENIFNKFVRDERIDRFRAIRGLGLGLYVARLIAKVH